MNAWMHVAGWVLVHFVWQGAVVALVAGVGAPSVPASGRLCAISPSRAAR